MWFSELFAYTDDETGDPLDYSSEYMAMEIAADGFSGAPSVMSSRYLCCYAPPPDG
jgi:hypothetical protein